MDDVEKSAHGLPFNPTAQTAKDFWFTVRCEECQKPRLEVEIEEKSVTGSTKNDKSLSYMCWASLAEYVGIRDRWKVSCKYFFFKNKFTLLLHWLLCNMVHLLWRWWHKTHVKQVSGALSTVPKPYLRGKETLSTRRTSRQRKKCTYNWSMRKT